MPTDPAATTEPEVGSPTCECAQRGMTGGKAHPLCPVHGVHDAAQTCFEIDGAKVRGDPNMSDESREALRDVISAAGRLLDPDEGHGD